MQLLIFWRHYLWTLFGSWLGITFLLLSVLRFVEWIIDKKAPIPRWIRLTAFAALLFVAQAVVYKKLADNPPIVISTPTPPALVISEETHNEGRSGNATTSGDESPAVTGGRTSITYGQPPDSNKQKSRPPK
jgi:hypothetical protein